MMGVVEVNKVTINQYYPGAQKAHLCYRKMQSLVIGNKNLEVASSFRYLGDKLDSKESYSIYVKPKLKNC